MLEVVTLFIIMTLIAILAFLPFGYSLYTAPNNVNPPAFDLSRPASATAHRPMPEDSTLKRHFLSSLEAEVKSAYAFQPSDSMLKRHYDAQVAAEVNKKLSAFAS